MVGMMLAAAIGANALAASPKVFKCTDAHGVVVFTPQPCGKDAQAVDTSAALRVPSDTGASATEAVSNSVAKSQLDIDCNNRRAAVADGYGGQLNGIAAQIGSLRRSKDYSFNNNAGETRNMQIETQISGLETRRSAIMTAITQQQMAVDSDCNARREALAREQREAAAAKTPTPPPAAPPATAERHE